MKAKILNVVDVHLLSNPQFCRGGQNDNFEAKLQGVKNDKIVGTGKLVGVDCY